MQMSGVSSSREAVASTIKAAARDAGGDFGYLLRQAQVESGLDPHAKASTSSATGLFQFIDDTWMTMVRRHGPQHGLAEQSRRIEAGNLSAGERAAILDLRKDPALSTRMAAEFAAENARALKAAGTERIGATELYLAHFLGAGGAVRFMEGLRERPSAAAASALPKAAEANPSIFHPQGRAASFREVYDRFAKKFDGVDAPSAEFKAAAAAAVTTGKAVRETAEPAFRSLATTARGLLSNGFASPAAPAPVRAPAGVITAEAVSAVVGGRAATEAAPDAGAPVAAETVAKFLQVVSHEGAPHADASSSVDASGRDASMGARL